MSESEHAGDSLPGLSEVIDALRVAGPHPSRALADAAMRFGGAAVAPLCALLRARETWEPEALPECLLPIHLIYLLGCLGDPRATPTLVEVMQTHDLGDLLTEDMDSVLAALGPEAIPTLVTVLLDHRADPFVRNAVGRGLYLAGCANVAARSGVCEALARVIREADFDDQSDLSAAEMLVGVALRTGDRDAIAAVRDAFARGLAEGGFADESILERTSSIEPWQLRPRDASPITHFERAGSAPRRPAIPAAWREVPSTAVAKVGRNEPCPCGSGKKFKKCCGR